MWLIPVRETFYSVLGVETDADRETIQRAYREHVKETHPDVSDSPDAAERFKRLTTARDVLVDGEERRRYDRLGHEAYVSRHVEGPAWADGSGDGSASGERSATAGSTRDAGGAAAARNRSRRQSRHRADAHTGRRARAAGSGGGRSRVKGGYGDRNWQAASDAYTRTPMDVDAGRPSVPRRLLAAARALGPWLVVDLVLILSAIATGWFLYATGVYFEASVPAAISGLLLVVFVIGLALLHMLLELYS